MATALAQPLQSERTIREARENAQVRLAVAAMRRALDKIEAMPNPRDFLGSYSGIAFCHAAYDLTGIDALYDMAKENAGALRDEAERVS